MFIILLIYPFLMALIFRYLVSYVRDYLMLEYDGFNLIPYYPMIEAFMIITFPMIIGILSAFMLLDERDDNVHIAIKITPVPDLTYLGYRLFSPFLLAFITTFVILEIAGLGGINAIPVHYLILCATITSFNGVLIALFLVTAAKNKVEGIAFMKGIMLILLSPLIVYLMDSNYQFFITIIPTFWVAKTYFAACSNDLFSWIYFVGGVSYSSLLMIILYRIFRKRIFY